MLIPSIHLQGGRIVQLVQGERLAVETDDVEGWIQRFAGYPKVQLIDLDAAKGTGANEVLIATICGRLPCRVGGGIRTPQRAQALVGLGATGVILGSSLFKQGAVDVEFAQRVFDCGLERGMPLLQRLVAAGRHTLGRRLDPIRGGGNAGQRRSAAIRGHCGELTQKRAGAKCWR